MSVARNVICWRRLTELFPSDTPGCDRSGWRGRCSTALASNTAYTRDDYCRQIENDVPIKKTRLLKTEPRNKREYIIAYTFLAK